MTVPPSDNVRALQAVLKEYHPSRTAPEETSDRMSWSRLDYYDAVAVLLGE